MATGKPAHDETQTRDEGPRGFGVLLSQIDDGELHTELSETSQKLVAELADYANRYRREGKGKIVLTLNFAALSNGTVAVSGDVKTTTPKAKRAGSVFWRTPGNNLSVENPRQTKLPLQALPATKETPRDLTDDRPARGI